MPFLGRDWRSPGDQWIRTEDGWQKMKIWRIRFLENLNENIVCRLLALLDGEYQDVTANYQPYVFVPKRRSRENNIWPSLCEVLNRLDIIGGVKDRRRQDYVWKLLQLLIKNKMPQISGDAQKQVLNILEQLLNQVIKTQTKPHQMQKLLDALKYTLEEHRYHHMGTSQLWEAHLSTLHHLQEKLNTMQIQMEENGMKLHDLPEEILQHIISCLSDHSDIMRMGMTNKLFLPLVEATQLWRRMCTYHFKEAQIDQEVRKMKTKKGCTNNGETAINEEDWRFIYRKLYGQYGRKEDYVDTLCLCNYCSCLFWKNLGHLCIVPQTKEMMYKMVTPQDFINLFSV